MILRVINILLISMLVVLLYLAWTLPSKSQDLALGDSIALGVGHALGVQTIARVGAASCDVLAWVPELRYHNAVVSAGINDPPGRCVEAILRTIQADKIVVILPAAINSARANVEIAATQYKAYTLSYTCLHGCTRRNFHPSNYNALAQRVRAIWNEAR